MKSASLQEILIEELRDLFDAEKQLVRALPKMAKSVSDDELETAFRNHLEVTKTQVQRLEQVFAMLDQRARSKPCKGMAGLVAEGQEIIEEHGDQEGMLDAELAGAGRKVEHYEMAGYESARSIAQQLGLRDAAQLLQETLREEMETDRLLAQISKRLVKEMARGGAQPMEEGGARQRSSGTRARGQARPSGKRAGSQSRGRGGRSSAGHGSQITTDHEEIRRWAEERGAHPACVRGTGDRQDTGMIRLDFPGFSGEQSLQPISWDDWFEKFDRNNLALLYQETTAGGQKSNFNKLIGRETGAHARGGRRGAAREKARAAR